MPYVFIFEFIRVEEGATFIEHFNGGARYKSLGYSGLEKNPLASVGE
jgi:hypothetical protein